MLKLKSIFYIFNLLIVNNAKIIYFDKRALNDLDEKIKYFELKKDYI